MKPPAHDELTISEAIDSLRTQLREAIEWGDGEDLRFAVDGVEVELQLTVAVGFKGETKVGLWSVVTAGGEISRVRGQNHVVRLKLQPEMVARQTRPSDPRIRITDND